MKKTKGRIWAAFEISKIEDFSMSECFSSIWLSVCNVLPPNFLTAAEI